MKIHGSVFLYIPLALFGLWYGIGLIEWDIFVLHITLIIWTCVHLIISAFCLIGSKVSDFHIGWWCINPLTLPIVILYYITIFLNKHLTVKL